MAQQGDDYLERLAMSEVTTFNWTIDADLAGYARHGFPGIEALAEQGGAERCATTT